MPDNSNNFEITIRKLDSVKIKIKIDKEITWLKLIKDNSSFFSESLTDFDLIYNNNNFITTRNFDLNTKINNYPNILNIIKTPIYWGYYRNKSPIEDKDVIYTEYTKYILEIRGKNKEFILRNLDIKAMENIYGPIEDWDTSKITDMSEWFSNSTFNKNISKWNTESVTDMSFMFFNCKYFNQDLWRWDVENLLNVPYMFCKASSFSHNLGWNLEKPYHSDFIENMFLDTPNFSGFKPMLPNVDLLLNFD